MLTAAKSSLKILVKSFGQKQLLWERIEWGNIHQNNIIPTTLFEKSYKTFLIPKLF